MQDVILEDLAGDMGIWHPRSRVQHSVSSLKMLLIVYWKGFLVLTLTQTKRNLANASLLFKIASLYIETVYCRTSVRCWNKIHCMFYYFLRTCYVHCLFLCVEYFLIWWQSPMLCFSCDQAALWMVFSVRLSVRHTFLTMLPSSYHHEIFGSYYQWPEWGRCKRSRSEVKGQGHRGKNPTYRFPDRNSSLNWHVMMKWCTKLDIA